MSIQRLAHLWPLRGSGAWGICEGYYGDTRLDGVRFARAFSWPGAIHEGNGTRLLIVDQAASPDQRKALLALESGTQGGIFFEIFAAMCPNVLEPIFAPITFQADRERRRARVLIPMCSNPGLSQSAIPKQARNIA